MPQRARSSRCGAPALRSRTDGSEQMERKRDLLGGGRRARGLQPPQELAPLRRINVTEVVSVLPSACRQSWCSCASAPVLYPVK